MEVVRLTKRNTESSNASMVFLTVIIFQNDEILKTIVQLLLLMTEKIVEVQRGKVYLEGHQHRDLSRDKIVVLSCLGSNMMKKGSISPMELDVYYIMDIPKYLAINIFFQPGYWNRQKKL